MSKNLTVKARLQRLVIISILVIAVNIGLASTIMIGSYVLSDYRKIAETATFHLRETLENGSSEWSYDEEEDILYCNGNQVNLEIFDNINAKDKDVFHTVFWGNKRILTNIKNENGQYAVGTTADEAIFNKVKAGNTYTQNNVKIFGEKYTVSYIPIYNGSEFCGMLFTGINESIVTKRIAVAVAVILGGTLLIIVIVLACSSKLLKNISDHLSEKLNGGYNELNAFSDNIQNISTRTNKEVAEITTAMDAVANGATSQAAATQQAMASTEEFSASIDIVNNEIKDSYNFIDTIKGCVQDSQNSIDELNESIDYNNRLVDNISCDIEDGVESSRKANTIVKTIDNLAFQINLLALNASVEASHAGEYGRGFAVVANEIKNLASSSAKSAGDTADIIKDIVETMSKTKESNDKLVESNKAQLEKAETVYNKMLNLKEYVEELVKKLDHIKENSDSLDCVKNELVNVIQSLSSTSEDNAAVCEQVCASTTTVSSGIDNLTDSLGQIDEICSNMESIIEYFG